MKRSIFFKLSYWKQLLLRYNLDVIHIEKNICDTIIGIVLNISEKNKRWYKSSPWFTENENPIGVVFSSSRWEIFYATCMLFVVWWEKKIFCGSFKTVKFSDAYASNVSRCVGNNDSNISGMKSHDSHMMIQRLLPVVMHGYLGGDVWTALIELGVFFRELCCQKLKINLLERSEKDIVLIFYKLEKNIFIIIFWCYGASDCSSFKESSFGQTGTLSMVVSY